MSNEVIISADSHVMEPADLWTSRLPAGLRDQAPEVRRNPDKPGWLFFAPTLPPSTVAGSWGAGVDRAKFREHLETAGYESARPSGWDPAERLKDQGHRRRARRGALRHARHAAVPHDRCGAAARVLQRLQRLAGRVLRATNPSACTASGSSRCGMSSKASASSNAAPRSGSRAR